MRLRSEAELPPVYHMDKFDLIFMVVIGTLMTVFTECALLYWPGFDDALLFVVGLYWMLHIIPQLHKRAVSTKELRRFRKELDKHGHE